MEILRRFSSKEKKRPKPKRQFKLIRILVLGAAKVGKTAIIGRILGEDFNDRYKRTIYDVFETEIDCEHGHCVFHLIDTGGDYEFPAMRDLAISKADICLIVYSLNDDKSLEEAKRIEDMILVTEEKNATEIPFILVGNKVDIQEDSSVNDTRKERNSDLSHLEELCVSHILTSAKDGINISNLVKTIAVESETLGSATEIRLSVEQNSENRLSGEFFTWEHSKDKEQSDQLN